MWKFSPRLGDSVRYTLAFSSARLTGDVTPVMSPGSEWTVLSRVVSVLDESMADAGWIGADLTPREVASKVLTVTLHAGRLAPRLRSSARSGWRAVRFL